MLANLENLKFETTDLSERDIIYVEIGEKVIVLIEALDMQVEGKVSAISPISNNTDGDIVYTTTIELEKIPGDLRWGMSAIVEVIRD